MVAPTFTADFLDLEDIKNSSTDFTFALLDGAANFTQTSNSFGTKGFRYNSTGLGTGGGRFVLDASTDFSAGGKYLYFQATYNGSFFPNRTDTIANGGFSIYLVDSSGDWNQYHFNGSDVLDTEQSGAWKTFQTLDNNAGIERGYIFTLDLSNPDDTFGACDLTDIIAIEGHFITTSSSNSNGRGLFLSSFAKTSQYLLTGGEVGNEAGFADFFTATNTPYRSGIIFANLPVTFNGLSGAFYNVIYDFSIGDGLTTGVFRSTGETLSVFASRLALENNANVTRSYGVAFGGDPTNRIFSFNQTATCDYLLNNFNIAAADNTISEEYVLQIIGNTAGTFQINIGSLSNGRILCGHGNFHEVTFSQCAAIEVDSNSVLTECSIRNGRAGSAGLLITSGSSDYSTTITTTFRDNLGDDITLGEGGAGTYDLTGISVANNYTLKIRNNSATNAITVSIPQGITITTTTAGGTITIDQPQQSTDVTIINLTSTSVLLRNNLGATVDFQQTVTGTYTFSIDPAESGTWSVRLDRQGYRRRTDTFQVDGNPKDFGGFLEELLNVDGTSKYTATSSTQIAIDAINENIIVRQGFTTAQIVFDMIQDAAITQAGMENDSIARIDYSKASFGNDFLLGSWQFILDPAETQLAYITEANIFHDTNQPLDTTNGLVSFTGGIQLTTTAGNTPAEIATAVRIEMDSNSTDLNTLITNATRLDGLIEDDGSGNDRFTTKALEQGPSGSSSLDQSAFDTFMLNVPNATKDTYKADVSAIPINPLLTTDSRITTLITNTNRVDGLIEDVSGDQFTVKALTNVPSTTGLDEASLHTGLDNYTNKNNWQADISAIPTNPLLTTDIRLNNLDATISGLPLAIRTDLDDNSTSFTTLIANSTKLDGLVEDDGSGNDRFTTKALEQGPSGSSSLDQSTFDTFMSNVPNTTKDTYKADISAIPTNPLLTTDARLNNLDVAVSTLATQVSVNNLPLNIRTDLDSNSTSLNTLVSNSNTIDDLIENVSGNRFTAKALELSSGTIDQPTFDSLLANVPNNTKDAYKADLTNVSTFNASTDEVLADIRQINNVNVTNIDDFKADVSNLDIAVSTLATQVSVNNLPLAIRTDLDSNSTSFTTLVINANRLDNLIEDDGSGNDRFTIKALEQSPNSSSLDQPTFDALLLNVPNTTKDSYKANLSALQSAVSSIPTNPLLTTDSRLNNLDATISSRSTQISVNNLPLNIRTDLETNSTTLTTIFDNTNRLDSLLESNVGGDRFLGSALALAPTGSIDQTTFNSRMAALPNGTKDTFKADTTLLATEANVNSIPKNPLITTDPRLNNLDATISSRSDFDVATTIVRSNIEQVNSITISSINQFKADVTAIPTNPLLTNDLRLDRIDTTISSRSNFNPNADVVISNIQQVNGNTITIDDLKADTPTVNDIRQDLDSNSTTLNTLLTNSTRLDDLIEPNGGGGDRFTVEALDNTTINQTVFNNLLTNVPLAIQDAYKADVNSLATQTTINNLPINIRTELDNNSTQLETVVTNTTALANLIDVDRFSLVALSNTPAAAVDETSLHTGLDSYSNKDDYKADVSAIPTNPLLTTDIRLNNLDALISSRSTFNPTADEVLADVRQVNNVNVNSVDDFKAASTATDLSPVLNAITNLNDVSLTEIEDSAVIAKETSIGALFTSVANIPTTDSVANLTPVLTAINNLNDVSVTDIRSGFDANEFKDKNTESELHQWLDSYLNKDDWKATNVSMNLSPILDAIANLNDLALSDIEISNVLAKQDTLIDVETAITNSSITSNNQNNNILTAISSLNDVSPTEVRQAFNPEDFKGKNTQSEIHQWLDSYTNKDDWKEDSTTNFNAVSSQIGVVLSKTDNLPDNPASVSDIPTAQAIRLEIDTNSNRIMSIGEKNSLFTTLDLIRKLNTNSAIVDPLTNSLKIYDDDGTTVIAEFTTQGVTGNDNTDSIFRLIKT